MSGENTQNSHVVTTPDIINLFRLVAKIYVVCACVRGERREGGGGCLSKKKDINK